MFSETKPPGRRVWHQRGQRRTPGDVKSTMLLGLQIAEPTAIWQLHHLAIKLLLQPEL